MGLPSSRGQGPAYIVPSSERGPSDQTNINRTVFLNPLGQWSISMRRDLIGLCSRAGAQGGRAGALPLGPLGLPFVSVASGVF